MSDIAIKVENLSKVYRIGLKEQRHDTLLGAVASFVRSPWENYKTLRKLSHFEGMRTVTGQSSDSMEVASPSDIIWALKNVSFEVDRGEVLGIIGSNGAGKSTLLKVLSRITEPTSGGASIYGRVVSLLEVGTGFHPDLTGRENVYLNGTILGMTKKEVDRKFDEIVTFSEVERFIDTPVKRYSSGMRVRLAFAVAAHLEPEILIVDEVLAVGDVAFQKKCLGKMHDVAGHGRTILFVSHNMAALLSLCPRAILLDAGSLAYDGICDDTVTRYLDVASAKCGEKWSRPAGAATAPLIFQEAVITNYELRRLSMEVVLQSAARDRNAVLAFDVRDSLGTPLMQIVTEPQPFVSSSNSQHRLQIDVEMPPLIPGRYSIDLWVGYHFSATADHVPNALTFESVASPIPGRSFPYTKDHGCLALTAQVRGFAE